MDYLRASLAFKIAKVLRYMRLYGPRRTFAKVAAQRHVRRTYSTLPPTQVAGPDLKRPVALIGCGNYAYSTIAHFLKRRFGNVIGICMDTDINRAASMSVSYNIPCFTADAAPIFANEAVKLIYIASNHASHAEYAIRGLQAGKSVYIEKPHVISEDQLKRLVQVMNASEGRVFLGFNRPGSRFGGIIQEKLSLEQGSGMYNWFIAGHELEPGHWYFKPEEGGRVLGNLCHWTDFVFRLVGGNAFPIRIVPAKSPQSDSDISVSYVFGEGSIASITFSAKGHTFEGVKERFAGHKGNCLVAMDDFERLVIDVLEKKQVYRNLFRDHGHERNIVAAFDAVRNKVPRSDGRERAFVANTGWLFLKTKEALDANTPVTINAYGA